MTGARKIYVNNKWLAFSEKVKRRDGYRCLRCGRGEPEVVLQVHHEIYVEGRPPWGYPLSDCRTLCRGCHARAHGRIEPESGWTLLVIEDLGGLDGVCERHGCGNEIRYAHLTYHPAWGYKVVGSTCVGHLTRKDRVISGDLVRLYKNISQFVHESSWERGVTKKGNAYISCVYRHHTIRIYGQEGNFSYQLVLKEKGVRWHDYRDPVRLRDKSQDEVKELAYIALKGTIAADEEEKGLLREIYRKLK